MRRPHVYERSAPRAARTPYEEPATEGASAARSIAYQLGAMIVMADGAGLSALGQLLQSARTEAERRTRD
jgi:hypothetical protein